MMETKDIIRLNLKIHPDKDPALYKLMNAIAKESRVRRVLNLASHGILAEAVGLTNIGKLAVSSPAENDALTKNDSMEEVEVTTAAQDIPTSIKPVSGIVLEAGEADALGDMFN
jgi:hypothetical protein